MSPGLLLAVDLVAPFRGIRDIALIFRAAQPASHRPEHVRHRPSPVRHEESLAGAAARWEA
jgi:hypothetical protein